MNFFFTLLIRGLSCPSCIQASLSRNCLKLTIPGFPYNCLHVSCGDIGFKKNPWSSIGLEIRSRSTAFWALLPSANYSAEWSEPLLLAEGCHAQPKKFKFKQKGCQTANTICRGLSHTTGRAALPSDNISGRFFQGWRNPLGI